MNIEQELSDFLDIAIGGIEYPNMNILAKAILSSGLVIPVSVLDGMVEKVEAAIKKTPSLNGAFIDHKRMAENAINAKRGSEGKYEITTRNRHNIFCCKSS